MYFIKNFVNMYINTKTNKKKNKKKQNNLIIKPQNIINISKIDTINPFLSTN